MQLEVEIGYIVFLQTKKKEMEMGYQQGDNKERNGDWDTGGKEEELQKQEKMQTNKIISYYDYNNSKQ